MITTLTDRFTIETAAGEVLAAVIARPDLWPQLSEVYPEWFEQWGDQRLWQAICVSVNETSGFCDPNAVDKYLRDRWPDETEGLLIRWIDCYGRWVHPEYLLFHLGLLRENGVRNALFCWTTRIQKGCRENYPLNELKEIVANPPEFGRGGGGTE